MLSVDLYTAFKQILFSVIFFRFCYFFFSNQLILETKKIGFSSVIFNIQKYSVSPFSSVDRLQKRRTYFGGEENFNIEFSSPPDGEENFNLEFSSGELGIEVHLSTIYIQELRILGPHI